MKLKLHVLLAALSFAALVLLPPAAFAQETCVTVGADTTFKGLPINGLQSGYGIGIASTGSALGQFCTVLLGINSMGLQQNIIIEGVATSGSQPAGNIATFSGTCTVNMGDGSPPLPGVPFTATITTNAFDQGTIGLILGDTTLPAATINQGSMTIQ
ncbi:MAG: hypothetical protein DMF57_13140 [Acidobacteria bacterium]|nr:MAG: hypothetical protein DMF57_13140 [Acidobacteriota bacterium]